MLDNSEIEILHLRLFDLKKNLSDYIIIIIIITHTASLIHKYKH
jgi:hypothetical protein